MKRVREIAAALAVAGGVSLLGPCATAAANPLQSPAVVQEVGAETVIDTLHQLAFWGTWAGAMADIIRQDPPFGT